MFEREDPGSSLPRGDGPDDPVHLTEGSPAGDEAIVLAAGTGTRMGTTLPKVLQPLAGKPMLARTLDGLAHAGFSRPLVVTGDRADEVERAMGARCRYVRQEPQRGTGDAVRVALESLPGSVRRVLVVNGDDPMVAPHAYREMMDAQERASAAAVILSTHTDDPRGLGRVVRDPSGSPLALVPLVALSPEQEEIDEVPLGAYLFSADFLRLALPRLQPRSPKGEYLLTDVVAVAVEEGHPVASHTVQGGRAVMGINDLVQLEQASKEIYQATNRRHMLAGVRILDSASTFIDDEVEVAPGAVVLPFSIITGGTSIGTDSVIGPHATVEASRIGAHCRVESSTVRDAVVEDGATIGPYAHIRQGTHIGAGCEVGTHAEIKRARLGPGSRMHHFGYLGDATVGADVNIGAGTVTCNFDGQAKHQTVIEDRAFIGSDTMLRAPVTIGEGAATGAGSVVLHDVPAGSTAAGVPARIIRGAGKGPRIAQQGKGPRVAEQPDAQEEKGA